MGRWQKVYLEDRRARTSPPSLCAKRAAQLFKQHRKSVILDLGCGAGRDTAYLAEADLAVIGADVEAAGFAAARQRARGTPARSAPLSRSAPSSTSASPRRPLAPSPPRPPAHPLTAFLRADARMLPFAEAAFEGIYSFGLLHEFTSIDRDHDIQQVMREIHRILQPNGLLVLAVLSGDFRFGLPDVYLFSEAMFREATKAFAPIEIKEYEDIGCTGKTDYKVWYGAFMKTGDST